MSSYISSINPINWFNYRGDKNLVKFSKGINILVGTNNAGKTKLHNAFRFIISDTVVLKVKEGNEKVFKEVSIGKPDYLIEVINQTSLNQLNVDETLHVGVELIFQKSRNTETTTYQLKKGFEIKKGVSGEIEILNSIKDVFKIDPYTSGSRRVNEDFDEILSTLIPSRLKKFFLIEGEQMGMMTPLFGDGLKSTVKRLTNIDSVDKTVDLVNQIQKKVKEEKNRYEKSRKDLTQKEKELLENRIEKEKYIEKLNEKLIQKSEIRDELNSSINSLESSYNNSKSKRIKLEKLKQLKKEKEIVEKLIDDNDREYLDSLTNGSDFLLSKYDEFKPIEDTFSTIDNTFNKYLLDRKTELNNKVSEEEQKLLGKLNLSQPHPTILEEMVNESQCFVCKSELTSQSKRFINEILIPHFKGETFDNDDELKNLERLKDSLKNIFHKSKRYSYTDYSLIDEYGKKSSELYQKLKSSDVKIEEFISSNGDENELDDTSNNTFIEYGDKSTRLGELKIVIDDIKNQIQDNTNDLKELKSRISNSQPKEDNKSKKINELEGFINDLDEIFEGIKEDVYYRFGEDLENKSTKRFENLMRNNPSVKGQSLKVEINKIEQGFKTDYKFEVFLQDKNGNRLTQTGGASSTLEPLSVVFGLIDISDIRSSCPFIADAPISRLTNDTKYSFFETLVEDKIFDQSIIISMDLWDNKLDSINELGESVLELLKDSENSSFATMKPELNNQGVKFNYILNGE